MTRTPVALLTAAAIALGGCGDGDTAEQETEPAPATTPTPTETETATDETQGEQTEAAEPAERTYRVRSGDTLTAIAERFDTTVRAIVRLNDIDDPNHIRAGQELRIPPPN